MHQTCFSGIASFSSILKHPNNSLLTLYVFLYFYHTLSLFYNFFILKFSVLLFFKQTALSWFSLSFNVDDGVIDLEAVAGRLSYASSLLLASVAFLYISAESIPKLPYLTTLDQMM